MTHEKFTPLTPELYRYILNRSKPLPSALRDMEAKNESHPQIHMQIAADQANFLRFLIKSKSMKRILELGTFLGYSTAAMAEALPPEGKIISCDRDKLSCDYARQAWKQHHFSDKIETMIGPALVSMQTLLDQGQTFDFIFIDADKVNYLAYYQLAKKLLEPKGIIAVDNTLFHGEVLHPEKSKAAQAIHEFNCYVKEDMDVEACLLPIADGLSLIQFK